MEKGLLLIAISYTIAPERQFRIERDHPALWLFIEGILNKSICLRSFLRGPIQNVNLRTFWKCLISFLTEDLLMLITSKFSLNLPFHFPFHFSLTLQ